MMSEKASPDSNRDAQPDIFSGKNIKKNPLSNTKEDFLLIKT